MKLKSKSYIEVQKFKLRGYQMIVKAIGIAKNIEKKTIGANFHNLSGHKGFYMSTQALKKIKQNKGQITNAVIDTNGYIIAKPGHKLPIFIRVDSSKFFS